MTRTVHTTRVLSTLYSYIARYYTEHGVGPSQREMAAATQIAKGSLTRYLDILEARGDIVRHPNMARGVVPRLPNER